MNRPEICDRYARALIGLAEKNSQLDAVEAELTATCEILAKNPGVGRVIASPTVTPRDKENLAAEISKGASPLLGGLLKVLVQKKHFEELSGIRDEYHRLFEIKKGILEIQVITAIAIPEPVKNKLRTVCRNKWRCEVRLLCEKNPSILGGMILRFDGKEIDACYRTRLAEIRRQLMA
jgi:F-type H+-transporting ATPase subunit delta